MDVQLSQDGVAVVFHDDDLGRTTDGRGAVAAQDHAELADLDAGRWFADAFRGEPIPTLGAVLASLEPRIALDVELKAGASDPSDALAHEVGRLLLEHGAERRVLLSSFSIPLLAAARRLLPNGRRLMLHEGEVDVSATVATAAELGVTAVGLEADAADAETISALHAANLAVLVFTVNDVDSMRRLLTCGADGLFTNEVLRLRRLVGGEA